MGSVRSDDQIKILPLLHMLLGSLITQFDGQVPPDHLTARVSTDSLLVLLLFAGCIFITALARYYQRNVFVYLTQGVFFMRNLDDLEREDFKALSTSSLLLLFQFLVITAGAIYWSYFVKEPVDNWWHFFVPLLVPSFYLLYQFFMMNTVARISGNPAIIQEVNYFTILLTEFFGLVFLFEFFVIYFQPDLIQESRQLMFTTYGIYLCFRFLRGFWIAFQQGIPWYYIILYFWTLEILPLLIVGKLLYADEFQYWINSLL